MERVGRHSAPDGGPGEQAHREYPLDASRRQGQPQARDERSASGPSGPPRLDAFGSSAHPAADGIPHAEHGRAGTVRPGDRTPRSDLQHPSDLDFELWDSETWDLSDVDLSAWNAGASTHPHGQARPAGRHAAPAAAVVGPGRYPGRSPQDGQVPGPRQEYLAAFEGLPPQGPAPDQGTAGADEDDQPAVAVSDPEHPAPPPVDGPATKSPRRAPKNRAFTSVAAAAVTTVLAVVVAGQFTDGSRTRGEATVSGDFERGDDATSRSHDRPTPAQSAAAPAPNSPESLDERLAQAFPLRDDLALSGAFSTVKGSDKGSGHGQHLRYRVDVEHGLPLDGELFARFVHETLNDPRSWGHGGVRTFERVSSGPADFVVTLASPGTTNRWCAKSGLDTSVDHVSCDSASTERVMINAYRWAQGAPTFGGHMLAYRQMLINHEVGHRLGHNHELCPSDGVLAPVMMQQTKTLTSGQDTCRANSWPYP